MNAPKGPSHGKIGATLRGRTASYTLGEEVGRGAFGVTHRAVRQGDEREVAIKLLRWDKLDNWKVLELFEREAGVLKGLDHPGIPAYVDDFPIGDPAAPDGFALVQEFVRGRTLQQIRSQGGLDAVAMLRWFVEILDVLHELHRRQPPLVHRDIAPKNIILEDGGRAHLIDFGAVQNRLRRADSMLGTSVGTFGFAPAEQFMGQATAASDIYSLGVTYVVMATGRDPDQLPQDGTQIDVRSAVAPLKLDARLSLLLERMTRADPARRLSDAFAIAQTARQVLSDLQPKRRPPREASAATEKTAVPPPPRRRPAKAKQLTEKPPRSSTASSPSSLAAAAPPLEPLETADGLIAARDRLAKVGFDSAWTTHQIGERVPIERAPISADGSHIALICSWATYVVGLHDLRLVPVLRSGSADQQGGWSADGHKLAISDRRAGQVALVTIAPDDGEPDVRIVDVDGLQTMNYDHAVAVSPAGDLFAIAADDVVLVATWADGEVVSRIKRPEGDQNDLFWTADGETLVAGNFGGTQFFDRAGGSRRQKPGRVAASPDGRLFAIARTKHPGTGIEIQIGRYSALVPRLRWKPTKSSLNTRQWRHPDVTRVCFSPDSRRVAVCLYGELRGAPSSGNTGWGVVILDAGSGEEQARFIEPLRHRPFSMLYSFGFSADSDRLFVQGPGIASRTQTKAVDQLFAFDIPQRAYLGAIGFDQQGNGIAHTSEGFCTALIGVLPEDPPTAPHYRRADVVRSVFNGGDGVDAALSEVERLARADLHARWRYFDTLVRRGRLASGGHLDKLVDAAAGLTHLLPHIVDEAEREEAAPRFGHVRDEVTSKRLTVSALTGATTSLKRRTAQERSVLFDELVTYTADHQRRTAEAARVEAARQVEAARIARENQEAEARRAAELASRAAAELRLEDERRSEEARRKADAWRAKTAEKLRRADEALAFAADLEAREDRKWFFKNYRPVVDAYRDAVKQKAVGAVDSLSRLNADRGLPINPKHDEQYWERTASIRVFTVLAVLFGSLLIPGLYLSVTETAADGTVTTTAGEIGLLLCGFGGVFGGSCLMQAFQERTRRRERR